MKRQYLSATLLSLLSLGGLLLGSASLGSSGLKAATIAISDFENPLSGVDGWNVFGDNLVSPYRVATGGNPAGYAEVVDSVVNGVMFWQAPSKFLGNISGAYGGTLAFDLKQSATDTQFTDNDIVLIGGGLTLVRATASHPLTSWTSYSILLTETGWHVSTLGGAAATQAQMLNTLGSLTELDIRAEFRTGADTNGLDNVILSDTSTTPEPGTFFMLAIGGLLGVLVSRRQNRSLIQALIDSGKHPVEELQFGRSFRRTG